VLYTGKGGVGKTTTAAAASVCAARRGRRTLVVSADAAHSLGDVLGDRLGATPVEVESGLHALELDARVETRRHWGRVQEFLRSLFRHQGIESVVADELAMLPGAEEFATLLAVEQYARGGTYDLIVVDCAPSDATLRLATLPEVLHGMARLALPALRALAGVSAPILQRLVSAPLPASGVFADVESLLYDKLAGLRRRISDPTTSVRLVVTPERMVIDEARRTYTELALFEVPCDAVVMNRTLTREAGREPFFSDWMRVQERHLREVKSAFAPLPVLTSPLQREEVVGVDRLARLGERIFADHEPDAVLCGGSRVRFERDGMDYVVRLPLPGARAEALDVAKLDGNLVVTTRARRRALKLPRSIAQLALLQARVDDAVLIVRFGVLRGAAAEST